MSVKETFRSMLADKRAEYEKQLKAVKENYPLVAMSITLLEATLAERAIPEQDVVSPIYTALTGRDTELVKSDRYKQLRCEKEMEACFVGKDATGRMKCLDHFVACVLG